MASSCIRKTFFWALLGAMLLTLAFIFSNSLRAPEDSMEQSSAVGGFFAELFSPDKPLGKFLQDHIRKIAHFCEFGLLGVEIAVFVIFYLQNHRELAVLSLPAGMSVALIDETLQYFSGRGPAIIDVWIDLGGFVTGSLFGYGSVMLILMIINRRRARKCITEDRNG